MQIPGPCPKYFHSLKARMGPANLYFALKLPFRKHRFLQLFINFNSNAISLKKKKKKSCSYYHPPKAPPPQTLFIPLPLLIPLEPLSLLNMILFTYCLCPPLRR